LSGDMLWLCVMVLSLTPLLARQGKD